MAHQVIGRMYVMGAAPSNTPRATLAGERPNCQHAFPYDERGRTGKTAAKTYRQEKALVCRRNAFLQRL